MRRGGNQAVIVLKGNDAGTQAFQVARFLQEVIVGKDGFMQGMAM